jgi:hypothetical protein
MEAQFRSQTAIPPHVTWVPKDDISFLGNLDYNTCDNTNDSLDSSFLTTAVRSRVIDL